MQADAFEPRALPLPTSISCRRPGSQPDISRWTESWCLRQGRSPRGCPPAASFTLCRWHVVSNRCCTQSDLCLTRS